MPPTAERLADALARLTVRIDEVGVDHERLSVPSYPDGPRPTSIVRLDGRGEMGRGEHVGWTEDAHARFAHVTQGVPRGPHRLGAWSAAIAATMADPYDRAALEAAAIDLALRQRGDTIFGLVGIEPRPLRYVVSIGRLADPIDAVHGEPTAELKLDADSGWTTETLDALAAHGRVAIVDWKAGGEPTDHARIAARLRSALVEDPGPARGPWPTLACAGRVSADGWLLAPGDLAALPAKPAAVNVKPGRMGGVFAALALASAAEATGIPIYVGGMFELGPGRRQAQALAALLSPDGPNDVAPIATGTGRAARPQRIAVCADRPGFGSDS